MTQEELKRIIQKVYNAGYYKGKTGISLVNEAEVKGIAMFRINQHVKEVIGNFEELPKGMISGYPLYDITWARNILKKEQLKRAELL